jgi:hypothetical protein
MQDNEQIEKQESVEGIASELGSILVKMMSLESGVSRVRVWSAQAERLIKIVEGIEDSAQALLVYLRTREQNEKRKYRGSRIQST